MIAPVKIAPAHARRMEYCTSSCYDGALQKLGVKRVKMSVSEQNKTKHKSGGAKSKSNCFSERLLHVWTPSIPGEAMIHI